MEIVGTKPARGPWVLALGVWLGVWGGLVGAREAAAASITGQVYEAATGMPARGVSLRLVYDDQDPDSPGAPVDPQDVGPGQQGQVTGFGGDYRFDVPGGRRYRLVLDTGQSPYAAPSTSAPPRAGFAPLGAVVPAPAPSGAAGAGQIYYLRFDVPGGGDQVRNNHIPVDRVSNSVTLVKRVDRPEASPGDVLRYTVTVVNGSSRDLTMAAGQAVYLLDAPARGLDIAPGRAMVRIWDGQTGAAGRLLRAGVDFTQARERPGSGRLVRFGPFDLAAGATLVLEYPATVGLDARPGTLDNRVVLTGAGGTALSPEGRARVHIGADPVLDSGQILGRVFCDEDGNGRRDAGEPALMGARVYLDTGSYAVTDADGAYHLSRVRPGTRLVKIDGATLAGGTVQGTPERLLTLTRGLSARVDFAVRCELVTVALGQDAGLVPAPGRAADPAPVEVAGEVAERGTGMTVIVAGAPVDLPAAALALEVPEALRAGPARNLPPVPASGYGELSPAWRPGWTTPGDIAVATWRLDIGLLGSAGTIAPVRTLKGSGALPERISWDGLGEDGAPAAAGSLYAAQLTVIGSARQARAASARIVFGIGLGAPSETIWRGALFTGDPQAPAATPMLEAQVAALAGPLGPTDRIEILAHAEDTGDRLSALVQTQKQAQLVASLLVRAGVSEDRIEARGRGSLELLQTDASEAAREANRRIVVTITPGAAPSLPETAPGPARVRVNREPVPLAGNRFAARARPAPGGTVLVEVQAPDGRRASLAVQAPVSAAPEVAGTSLGVAPPEVAGTAPGAAGEVAGTAPGPAAEVAGTAPDASLRAELRGELFTPAGQLTAETQARITTLVAQTPDGVRYRIDLAVAPRGSSAVETRLAQAARTAGLKKALDALGVAPERYELHARTSTDSEDSLSIETLGSELAQAPAAPPASLEPTSPDDHQTATDLAAPTGSTPAVAGAGEATEAPLAIDQSTSDPVTHDRVTSTVVRLPRTGTVLRSRTLAVTGRAPPGTRILVTPAPAGEPRPDTGSSPSRPDPGTHTSRPDSGDPTRELSAGADGRFAGLVTLPVGPGALVVRAVGPDGGEARLSWPVDVDDRGLFVMALGEVAASTAFIHETQGDRTRTRGFTADTAHLDGLDPASSVRVGPVRLHGRAAMYLKGTVPAGALAPRVDVTAHLDTARAPGTGAFFEQLTDPRTTAPTYGDAADEVRDANTRGRLYVHADAGHTRAVLGSVHTGLRGGDLFRYDRTVDGGLVQVDRAGAGYRVQLRGFGATGMGALRQDVSWYRATGGSLYYLRHAQVIEGSERVRVLVREADSGLTVSERALVRDRDYRIDYASGRVMLTQPLGASQPSPWLVDGLQTSAAPLLGHPVFLEVRYEHADPAMGSAVAAAGGAAGLYARGAVGRVSAGAGLVGERRDGGSYTLWGADAAVRAGERSRVGFEIAGSRRREADGFLSVDGGLHFADMAGGAIDVPGGRPHLAWKLTQHWHGGDLLDRAWAARTRLQLVTQHVDRGFSAGDAAFAQGRLELSALLTHELSARDALLVRHHTRIARLPQVGPTQDALDARPDPGALDRHDSHLTAVQWSRAQGLWHHRLEASHQRLTTDARLAGGDPAVDARRMGLAGATAFAYTPRLTLRAGQQVVLDLGAADPLLDPLRPLSDAPAARDSEPLAGVTSNVGVDWALTDELAVSADWYQRWNGDSAGQVGMRTALSETGAMYLRQRLGTRDGRPVATTIVGAEDRTGATGEGRTYGEYQLENSALGQRDRAVLGMGHGWEVLPGARLSLGLEHQQVLGGFLPDGTPLGTSQREVLHGSGAYTRAEQLEARARVELRIDHSTAGPLAVDDRRPGVPPGSVADHGGTAPGAPAALPPGRRIQVLLGTGVAWRWAPAHTLLGRAYLAHTAADADGAAFTEARSLELTAGWAYRPPAHDWLDLLFRYSLIGDLRPPAGAASAASAWHGRSHVLALVPLIDLPHRLSLSGKLAWKRSSLSEARAPDHAGTGASSSALLWLARLGYRLYGRWDAGFELRGLHLGKPARAREDRLGTLLELGYQIQRHIRLGIGYNISRFSDDELGDLERDSHGAFIRVTGHY